MRLRLVHVALLLALAPAARAEDVSKREKVGSGRDRIRGAVGLTEIEGGFLSVGGRKLRYLADGAKGWRVVHEVAGDSLYRVDADARGRVLAVWEKEGVFHLFDLRRGTDRRFDKPPLPAGYKAETPHWVDGVRFVDGGRAAIVFVSIHPWAYETGSRSALAAYWYELERKAAAAPVLLFSEEGFALHSSPRGAAIVKPKTWQHGCNYNGCSVDTIVAWEIDKGRATKKVVFDSKGKRVDSARIVRGVTDERFAVVIAGFADGKRWRKLLRLGYGARPAVQVLADPTTIDIDFHLLARNGDYLEARQGSDKAVTITRLTAAGEVSSVVVQPWADRRGRAAKVWFTSFGERVDGSLWLQWGDNIVVGDLRAPRKLDIGKHVGRGSEWAGAFLYDDEPESLWVGIEVGGGRDYVRIDFAEVERRARPWAPPTMKPGERGPMPPAVAARLSGTRREVALGKGVVSIGQRDLYYRESAKDKWRLLYAVPDRNIYRLQVDEARGRVIAQWSSERVFHLFEPGADVHRTFPWPSSDLERFNAGLANLFFLDDSHALVYMSGRIGGSGPVITEAHRVALDGKGKPQRVFRERGNYLDLSERGATFALPTKESAYRCDTAYCILDSIIVVTLTGDTAKRRVVYRRGNYTDYVHRVPGRSGDELAIVVKYSHGRGAQRALLRMRYGADGADTTILPSWTTEAVKRTHLTDDGDYLEFVDAGDKELVIELVGKNGARATWRIPPPRHKGGVDNAPDRGVYGFGERAGGGYWLHWGDHILLLRDGAPPRAFSIARRLARRAEWAGADRYTASPESLRIGMDVGAGRRFLDVPFAAIEKGAKPLR